MSNGWERQRDIGQRLIDEAETLGGVGNPYLGNIRLKHEDIKYLLCEYIDVMCEFEIWKSGRAQPDGE